MTLKSFSDVQDCFNEFVASNNIQITGAPHGAFWNTTYTSFVDGDVPNVPDPNTNKPIPILTKGDGPNSNIIYALSGTPNTLWDPNNPNGFGQMPAGGPNMPPTCPMGSSPCPPNIEEISDWITAGCPENAPVADT